MFNQYGSVMCNSCGSSMRLAVIDLDEAGVSTVRFECRYSQCARSRLLVIGQPGLAKEV